MWEYYICDIRIQMSGYPDRTIEILNEEGANGWELVAVTPDPTNSNYYRYYFKRPKK